MLFFDLLISTLGFDISFRRFYFDRTHKGYDWNEVKKLLSSKISSGKITEQKATEEMLALLKDKYSRYCMLYDTCWANCSFRNVKAKNIETDIHRARRIGGTPG